jgi:hypothetical protein
LVDEWHRRTMTWRRIGALRGKRLFLVVPARERPVANLRDALAPEIDDSCCAAAGRAVQTKV